MNARWPDTKAVIVIEINPDHLPEAIGDLQRFLSAHRLNAPEDQMLFGPIMHVAIEDVAQAVLKHFDGSPVPSEEWPPPPDVRTSVCGECAGHIYWQDCPTGGWWIHHQHPEDGHDALPDLETLLATLTTPVAEPES